MAQGNAMNDESMGHGLVKNDREQQLSSHYAIRDRAVHIEHIEQLQAAAELWSSRQTSERVNRRKDVA
jgi:hypothetical protein